jgi:phage terminase small subunit
MRKSLPPALVHFDNPDDTHKAQAAELRPAKGLTDEELEFWDEIAPILAQHGRLKPLYKYPLILLCKGLAAEFRLADYLRVHGETYESETRNGYQIKARPEVGQLNENRRLIRTYVGDFGLSPAAEKQLMNAASQLDLFGNGEKGNPFSDIENAANGYTLQ